jgi:hypothetical protein
MGTNVKLVRPNVEAARARLVVVPVVGEAGEVVGAGPQDPVSSSGRPPVSFGYESSRDRTAEQHL